MTTTILRTSKCILSRISRDSNNPVRIDSHQFKSNLYVSLTKYKVEMFTLPKYLVYYVKLKLNNCRVMGMSFKILKFKIM